MIKMILLLFLFLPQDAKPTELELIKKNSFHFKVLDGKLGGKGAELLVKKIRESQFFLLGEEHDMAALQLLTTAIVPVLQDAGYEQFAVETGPLSAAKLQYTIRKEASVRRLIDADARLMGSGPFGFFDTIEEEETLKMLDQHNMCLWGLDFENFNSSLFSLDELFSLSSKDIKIRAQYESARKFAAAEYQHYKKDQNYPLCEQLMKSEAISRFLAMLPNTPSIRLQIRQQQLSWKIYMDERKNNWLSRVENMYTNFDNYYRVAHLNQPLPKVAVKMGGVHLARGKSSSGFKEIGDHIHALAAKGGTKCFSVLSFARYRIDEQGMLSDLIEPEDEMILKFTNAEEWTLIDLNNIVLSANSSDIALSVPLQQYASKFDMLLIPPATKRLTPNFDR